MSDGLAWKVKVLAMDGGCVAHDDPADCEGEIQAHHAFTQQHLRRHGLDRYRWDERLGVAVCERAHRRHHSGRERIPRGRLPVRVTAFLEQIGFGWYLDRYYPA